MPNAALGCARVDVRNHKAHCKPAHVRAPRGKHGQCFKCDRLYCGDCNVAETMGRIYDCPICRAPFAVPVEVNIKRLLRLLARAPWRRSTSELCTRMARGSTGTEAARWYRLAANQGLAVWQCSLGAMYQNGAGVLQAFTEAVRLHRLAADQGLAAGHYIGNN